MPSRPNVLLVSTDHWSAFLLGVAGHSAIQTLTLDESDPFPGPGRTLIDRKDEQTAVERVRAVRELLSGRSAAQSAPTGG